MEFPYYTQLDMKDCGPTCLRIVSSYYGKNYSLATLRDKCHITREGVSMLGISDAAESIGFRTQGVKLTWEQLCNDTPMPCIVHWNQSHFVVVYKIEGSKGRQSVYVSDPASGLLKYDKQAFLKSWLSTADNDDVKCGIALLLEPTPQFYKEEGDESKGLSFGYLLKYIRPYRKYLVQLFIGLLVGSILSLILPFLTQSVVDTGIGNNDLNFVIVILIAQVMLVIGQMALSEVGSCCISPPG